MLTLVEVLGQCVPEHVGVGCTWQVPDDDGDDSGQGLDDGYAGLGRGRGQGRGGELGGVLVEGDVAALAFHRLGQARVSIESLSFPGRGDERGPE